MYSFKKISNHINIRNLFFTLLFICNIQNVYASDYFVCEGIHFKGLQHVSVPEAKSYLSFDVRDTISQEEIDSSVKKLKESGKFKNVKVIHEDQKITFEVEEYPIISSVSFQGNTIVSTENIQKVLYKYGIYEENFFHEDNLKEFKGQMLDFYSRLLRNKVDIEIVITEPCKFEKVIKIYITENDPTVIEKISIKGNKEFNLDRLYALFYFYKSSLYPSEQFKKNYTYEDLSNDVNNLYNFYYMNGYAEFSIIDTNCQYSKDKKKLNIILTVSEGQQFYITDIVMNEDTPLFFEKEKEQFYTDYVNHIYDIRFVEDMKMVFLKKLLDEGYLNSYVSIKPHINFSRKIIKFIIEVKKNKPCTLSKISFEGNSPSINENDLIQHFTQKVNTIIHRNDILKDIEYLKKTELFDKVTFSFQPSPDNKDQFELIYHVKVRHDNSFNFGVGYNGKNKLSYHFEVSNKNTLGKDNTISLNLSKSINQNAIKLLYFNPDFFKTGCSMNMDMFFNTTNKNFSPDKINYLNVRNGLSNNLRQLVDTFFAFYHHNDSMMFNYGSSARINYKISPYYSFNSSIGFSHDEDDLSSESLMQENLKDGSIPAFKKIKNNSINFSNSFLYQKQIDNSFYNLVDDVKFSADYVVPFKKDNYFRFFLDFNKCFPIFNEKYKCFLLFHCNSGMKYLENRTSLNSHDDFYANQNCCVRGYNFKDIGPTSVQYVNHTDDSVIESSSEKSNLNKKKNSFERVTVGGNIYCMNTIELVTPIPFINEPYAKNFQISAFCDFGNIWKKVYIPSDPINHYKSMSYIKPNDIRYSCGLSAKWCSPFGVISCSYAIPLGEHNAEEVNHFQVNFGS
ncbi:outer membrane protein assembly factor BamA [Buchnera aphidicola]|uniref:outer membrane protein assembly factor BamA n=1 Tax=Buchnera aphidicola TaxID=9 RepID=UPI0020928FCD|nr:outer membrane protein assembly factor BamA [Buchnera aphidicola]USS94286.1 outer membrane protein assembly factor BamA [Buchnera aphidicola (Sipha maydis)]